MRNPFVGAGLTALLLVSGSFEAVQAEAHLGTGLVAGQHIALVGQIKQLDTGPKRLLFLGDDGRTYTLDIAHAKVSLPSGSHPELMAGMRAYVSGMGTADGSITVTRFQVLAAAPPPPAAIPAVAETDEPIDLTVRGTVEAVSLESGSFVLRVNTHTRIVFVTADTDVTGLRQVGAGQFPVQPGQRVTVGGSLQSNGTLLAGVLTQKEDIDYHAAPNQPNRVLVGAVSSVNGKLKGRAFKLRAADGFETPIQVPRGIPVRRLGRSISMHDLNSRDQVRVTGRISGTDFRAARIDVLAPLPDRDPAGTNQASLPPASPPQRPGL